MPPTNVKVAQPTTQPQTRAPRRPDHRTRRPGPARNSSVQPCRLPLELERILRDREHLALPCADIW